MSRPKKSNGKSKILILILISIASLVGYWQWVTRYLETTDDAFVSTHIVYLKPRISGVMTQLNISNNQFVKKGSLIAQIDPSPFKVDVAIAVSKINSAKANLQKAISEKNAFIQQLKARKQNADATIQVARQDTLRQKAELNTLNAQIQLSKREARRYRKLERNQQVSQQRTEEVQTKLETLQSKKNLFQVSYQVAIAKQASARTAAKIIVADEQKIAVYDASIKQAKATLHLAEGQLQTARLHLQWTEMKAPHSGWVSKMTVRTGSQLSPNQAIGILVFGKPWINANFKETQIGRMQAGDAVSITVDTYDGLTLKGHIDSFQAGTGARFGLLPPENATGNFVKVVQRLPVKIIIDTPLPKGIVLWPGLSSTVTVNVNKHEQTGS